MPTQIARIGPTVAVEIPEELLRTAGLDVGDLVEWRLTPEGALELVRLNEEARHWEEILGRLTAPRDPSGTDEEKPEPDWTLTHGTEYKRPPEQ